LPVPQQLVQHQQPSARFGAGGAVGTPVGTVIRVVLAMGANPVQESSVLGEGQRDAATAQPFDVVEQFGVLTNQF